MVASGAHRAGPLKQQNKAHKGGKHRGTAQRRAGGEAGRPVGLPTAFPLALSLPDRSLSAGRVSVKALPHRRRRDLNRVDRRHQALQLRRQRKEAVRTRGFWAWCGERLVGWGVGVALLDRAALGLGAG